MASVANDLKEIREHNKTMETEGVNVVRRTEILNESYAEWVFTKDPGSDKILASRIEDLYGTETEV